MIEKIFTAALPSIEHFHLLGYAIAFLAALLETALVVGLLLPGSTLLLLLGAMSASGYLDFWDLLWFAVAGAVLGDNVNYWLGRRFGTGWERDGVWFMSPDHFAQARRFFDRHGAKSVFLGRFIPSVKEIAPFVAGTVGMRRHTFALWNILGGIGWGLQWVGGGYLFGQSIILAQAWMSRAGLALVVLLLVGGLLYLLQRFFVRRGREALRLAISLARSIKMALRRNPNVRRLVRRHPRTVRFVTDRVDRTHFRGLPLTLLVLAFGYVLALFAGIVEDVVTSDPIVAFDHASAQLISAFRAPAVISPFVWITNLGEPPVVGALLVVACLLAWLANRPVAIAGMLVSSMGAAAFSALSKLAFQRTRPIEAVLLESSYSFPSGHATMAVAFYGFVGYALIRYSASWKVRVNVFFATAVLAVLIGLSRIVLGVHYPSDVWAGWLVGALWLIVAISLTEWLDARQRVPWNGPRIRHSRAAALALCVTATAGLIAYGFVRTPPTPPSVPEVSIQLDGPFDDMLRAKNLSSTVTLLGEAEQPVSFAIAAPNSTMLSALLIRAGWVAADKPGPASMLRLARQGLDYARAPVAPAFWNGRMNDFAFEHPVQRAQGKAVATARLWQTAYRIGDERIFVGVVRQYEGIRLGVLHTISPDVDGAADAFVESIRRADQGIAICQRSLVAPMIGAYLMGEAFFTRGQVWLLDTSGGSTTAHLCSTRRESQ